MAVPETPDVLPLEPIPTKSHVVLSYRHSSSGAMGHRLPWPGPGSRDRTLDPDEENGAPRQVAERHSSRRRSVRPGAYLRRRRSSTKAPRPRVTIVAGSGTTCPFR